jgi:hypothetical protein
VRAALWNAMLKYGMIMPVAPEASQEDSAANPQN